MLSVMTQELQVIGLVTVNRFERKIAMLIASFSALTAVFTVV